VKAFKAYEPGFVHIDVKYLPAIDGEPRRYLFVAIDRATRSSPLRNLISALERPCMAFKSMAYTL
jgi:hypothetical protein